MTACKQCDFPDHLCGCDTQPAPPPEQEPCGWQFYQNGKWHNGMEANDHRVNTEAAGIPTRNVYPGPVAQPDQEPVASIGSLNEFTAMELVNRGFALTDYLYTAPPQREWQRLTDKEREEATGWSVEHIEAKLKEKNT